MISARSRAQTAPEEAYRKFDELSKKHIDGLRALTKNIQDARRRISRGARKGVT